MNSQQLCAAAGITYRQLDYWVRTGLVTEPRRSDGDPPGSGFPRDWPPSEAQVVVLAGRLVAAGMRPQAAIGVARDLTDSTWPWVEFAPGLRITLVAA